MIPGVEDLNDMSEDQLAALHEQVSAELASRQTRAAIVRDVTGAVDPIIRANRDLLGESWKDGRLSWDGHCMIVEDPGDEPAPVVTAVQSAPTVDPAAWEAGLTLSQGTTVDHDGRTYAVKQTHVASDDRLPADTPALYEEG